MNIYFSNNVQNFSTKQKIKKMLLKKSAKNSRKN